MTNVEHPGKILFVDADGARPDEAVDASTVPEEIRFARTDDGLQPVVKIVKSTTGDVRRIVAYGADGAVLRTTVQTRKTAPNHRRPYAVD